MKTKMKRVLGLVLVVVMCASLLCGCFGGSDTEDNTLVWCTTGKETQRTQEVLAKVNEILLEKTGYQVEFRYLSTQAYDLAVSSGEDFDLAQAPDYLNFWSNAAKGAFAEITDEDLKENAPYIWETGKEALNFVKLDGVRYSIPRLGSSYTTRCLAFRGDIMDKAGLEKIDTFEEIEKYLDYVKANYPDMIPFDAEGNVPYNFVSMIATENRWSPIHSASYATPVYFDLDDPEHKLFIAAEQPEMLELTETMKRWNDKGFFSKSVLSNKTHSIDSFKSGRSGMAFVANPAECQRVWAELSKDDRAAWDVRFYSRNQGCLLEGSVAGSMVAIGANTKKKEAALKVLNECYSNKELYRILTQGGIENVDWKELEDGSIEYITALESLAWFAPGVKNYSLDFNQTYTFPGSEELIADMASRAESSAAINMPKNEDGVREILVAMTEVWNQYSTPRCYGIMTKSPEETLKEEVQMLKKAGIDTYIEELQKQLDAFYESLEK